MSQTTKINENFYIVEHSHPYCHIYQAVGGNDKEIELRRYDKDGAVRIFLSKDAALEWFKSAHPDDVIDAQSGNLDGVSYVL